MTPEQKKKFDEAIKDYKKTWPKLTDDAEVNYEVDRFMETDEEPQPPWAEANEVVKQVYIEEVNSLFKKK